MRYAIRWFKCKLKPPKKNRKAKVEQLQRLCGLLNFLCHAIVPGRPFTMWLYANLAGQHKALKTPPSRQDVSRFLTRSASVAIIPKHTFGLQQTIHRFQHPYECRDFRLVYRCSQGNWEGIWWTSWSSLVCRAVEQNILAGMWSEHWVSGTICCGNRSFAVVA